MTTLILLSIVFTLLAGLTIKKITDWTGSDYEISWPEFAIGSAVASLAVIPLVVFVGWKIALASKVEYHEWWNGWEVKATEQVTTCHKDGSCDYTYDCDPYLVTHTSTDSKGNTTTYTTTEYHSCPYVTEEFSYGVETTLGFFPMGGTRWDRSPRAWRGDGDGDRDSTPNVPLGPPREWTEARDRIRHGDNGPVTKRADYDNYILASQSTILQQYSDSIKRYRKDGLLPKVAKAPFGYYQATKVYDEAKAVGADWVAASNRLNAALGTDLQGDLHVVVVPDVVDADNYSLSLQAYWGSPDLGKDALSKNGIVLVLGTDGTTVKWSRAFTGMPLGNNQMLAELRQSVLDKPLDARALFGHPTVYFRGGKPKIQHTDGIIEGVLWGDNKFERICMGCEGDSDKGVGYLYLKDELQPGTGSKVATFLVAFFLSMLVWVGALMIGTRSNMIHRRRYY